MTSAPPSKPRVVVADDHRLLLDSLAGILDESERLDLVGCARSGAEAAALIETEAPDVAVLDVNMPPPDGLTLAAQLQAAESPTRVVILTMNGSPALARQASAAGVLGVVLKDDALDALVQAVEAAAEGRTFLSPAVGEMLLQGEAPASLSPRELQILNLIARGHSTKQIAGVLDISHKTVDTHRTRLMRKLDVHSATELVAKAIRSELVVL